MPGRKSLLALSLLSFLPALKLQADCSPTVAVQVPATACKSGTATAGVIAVPGATYAWTVDGGQIAGDATGDHITIALGTNAKATASVTMTSGGCVAHGSGVIALHDPFGVQVAAIPAAHAGEPLTIVWNYANGTPGQQTISGDFGTVALAADVRNYTYTPQNSGSKQFVIDAALKQPASVAPLPSRQRAVAKSPAGASPCTLAHAAASYTVSECVTPAVVIDAPASVTADTTFDVSVQHQPGTVATWTITNGFPATATGDAVRITSASSGQVNVTVRLTRGACANAADRTIDITAKAACDAPKASVTTDPHACGLALVTAYFTGTPPFKGVWSDRETFETSNTSIVRSVIPGTYSIASFRDAICEGTASGVAVILVAPSATISGRQYSCTGTDTITARFTGRPPFSGCWNDGDCFQTNQTELTKVITKPGMNTLASGTDGTGCALVITGSVQTFAGQHVGLSRRCQWTPDSGNGVDLLVLYNGEFSGPASVTWSDGVKSGSTRYGLKPSQPTTYTVTGISDSGLCTTVWDTPKSITIYPTPVPEFVPDSGDLCFGSAGTTTLATPPPPGTKVEWEIQAGTLVSGQGTNSVQYQAGIYDYFGHPSNSMNVISTFTFADPNHCPLTTQRTRRVVPLEPYGNLTVNTTNEFHAGKTMFFTFSLGWDITDWSVTDSMNDTITLTGPCVPGSGICYASYTSTHGPGKSTITLHAKSACKTKDFSAELTILP